MKRKTIKELEAELAQVKSDFADYKEKFDRKVREISHLLTGNQYMLGWDGVLTFVAELKGKKDGMEIVRGQVFPWVNQEQDQANAKLWYLIRVAMKDETLRMDAANFHDYQKGTDTPFIKPRF